MKIRRSATALLIVASMLLQATGVLFAQSATPNGTNAGGEAQVVPLTRERINLMAPIQDVVSGPAWLMLSGRDVRPSDRFEAEQNNPYFPREIESSAVQPMAPMAAPLSQGGGAGVLVPYRDPAPAFSRNILMSRDFSSRTLQNEPDIAVNPKDSNHIVVGTIDYNFPSNSVYVSIDGGANWTGPIQTKYVRDDLGGAGDPVIKFDNKGNVYAASISLGFDEYEIGAAVGDVLVSAIAVGVSRDGGFTWDDPVASARSKVEYEPSPDGETDEFGRPRGFLKFNFLDKPWMAIGPHATIEDQEVIYVTYVRFTTVYEILYLGELPILGAPIQQSTPELVYSTDEGATWSDPIAVGPTVQRLPGGEEESGEADGEAQSEMSLEDAAAQQTKDVLEKLEQAGNKQIIAGNNPITQEAEGEAEGTKRVVQGVVPATDSAGNVYVFWFDSTDDDSQKGLGEFYMAKSEDGAETFSKPKKIASILEPGYRPRNAYFRYWSSVFPKVAIGPKDDLYLVYTALPPENPQDEGDVYMISSHDGGTKWTRPKRLNTDETNAPQFFPAVAVAPDDTVHVMWGDMRDDAIQTRYHIYYTSSSDQGETWGFKNEELGLDVGDTRVTDFSTNPTRAFPDGVFIGDYFGIAASNEDVYMVWADGRLGEYGGFNTKIGFARKRQVPNPEIFLSPDAGPGGETVTVQGFGFQPNITYYLQVGEGTQAVGRTNDRGEMTARLFMPISGEGAHPVALVDDSGNVASTTFYMEFGFDNIQKNLDAIDKELDEVRAGSALTTSTSSSGSSIQQIRNDVQQANASEQPNAADQKVAKLEKQVESLASKLDQQQASEPTIAAAGGFSATSPLALGLVGLAGLLLGAALTVLRSTGKRQV